MKINWNWPSLMIDIDYYRLISFIGLSINYVWRNEPEGRQLFSSARFKKQSYLHCNTSIYEGWQQKLCCNIYTKLLVWKLYLQKKLENTFKKQIFSELPNDTLFILRVILTIPSEIRERERRRDAFHLPRWWPPKADTFFRL